MQIFCLPVDSFSMLFFLVLLPRKFFACALAASSGSASVPAVIAFGDSIIDPGNNNLLTTVTKCNFPPYGRDFIQHKPTGRFSNGKIPTDVLVSALGIKELLPAYLDPQLKPDELLTGVSFASGGTGYDNLTAKIVSVLTLSDELELFKEYKEKLNAIAGEEKAARIISDSLYIVVVGTDDLANTYFTTPFRRAHYDLASYVDFLVQAASSFYQELYRLGARKIAVIGIPPVGCVPSQRTLAGGILRECNAAYNGAAIMLNSKLSKAIEHLNSDLPGLRIVYIGIYDILLDMVQRPAHYGFTEATRGCCGTGKLEVAILCNNLSPHTCTDVLDYIFWDSYHPTEKAYDIVVKKAVLPYLPL